MNKKVGLVLSGVVLSLGVVSIPVIAGTISKTDIQANVPPSPSVVTSQNIKTVANTPADTSKDQSTQGTPNVPNTPNNKNNSNSIPPKTMQNIHDSSAMQDAIKSGDINKMKDAMNSPEVKAQLGENVVNSMNGMMSNANINTMHGSGTQGSGMMGSGARNTVNLQ